MADELKKGEKEFEDIQTTGSAYQKERLYVREMTAFTYGLREELQRLRKVPRVIKKRDLEKALEKKKGPQFYNVNIITPKEKITQVMYAHYIVLAPGGKSDNHGHMNEAMFYILDGKGHEIHDGIRYDWEAGDVVVVENSCVHQHFNDDPDRPARALVIKAKPLYLFMNLIMQEMVDEAPKDPVPGHEGFKPTFLPE
ncbi:MAG: cupin domain-containing protein [Thermodesulfobacteriota bacterium]